MRFKRVIAGFLTAGILAGYAIAPQAMPLGGSVAVEASASVSGTYNGFSYYAYSGINYITISDYKGNDEKVTVPKTIKGMPVKRIEGRLFYGNEFVEKVVIPDSVEELPTSFFKGCTSLQSVTLPKNLKVLPSGTFENCKKLKKVTLPEGLKKISSSAFKGCESLTSIKLPKSLVAIEPWAFADTGLKKLELPDGLVTLSEMGNMQKLTSITVPRNVNLFNTQSTCFNRKKITFNVAEGSSAELYAELYGFNYKSSKNTDKIPAKLKSFSAKRTKSGAFYVLECTYGKIDLKNADGCLIFYRGSAEARDIRGNVNGKDSVWKSVSVDVMKKSYNIQSMDGGTGDFEITAVCYKDVKYTYTNENGNKIETTRRVYSKPEKTIRIKPKK